MGVRFVQPMIMSPSPTAKQHRWSLFFDNRMGTFVLQHSAAAKGSHSHGMSWILADDIERSIRVSRNMLPRVKGRLIRKARRMRKMLVPVAIDSTNE